MNILNDVSLGIKDKPVITNKNTGIQNTDKDDIMDIFSKKVVNKRDLTDMVTMPRAIFKGYLCFTAGTAFNAASELIKKTKISNLLRIAGLILSVCGTYNFVKPYLIKDNILTKSKK